MKHTDPDGYTLEYRDDDKLYLTGPTGQTQTINPGRISPEAPPILVKQYVKYTGIDPRKYFHVSGTNTLLRNSVRHIAEAACAEHCRKLDEKIKAENAALAAAVPGIEELKDAVADEERYQRDFERMMSDESNDGARPPRGPKADAAALASKYPRAALYLRAEAYSCAAHDAKAGAGQRAMEILKAGGSEEAAAQVLDNWLPASAWND